MAATTIVVTYDVAADVDAGGPQIEFKPARVTSFTVDGTADTALTATQRIRAAVATEGALARLHTLAAGAAGVGDARNLTT